jgi:tetratricopeptide (TPR) repeat protein
LNIKSYKFIFLFLLTILFFGCGKQKDNKLAQNYYKLALVELQDQDNNRLYSYKKAIEHIENAIRIEEKPEYLAFKATLLFELGDDLFGETLFNLALSKAQDSKLKCEILNNKACLFAQVGMYNEQSFKVNNALEIWEKLEADKDYLTPEVSLFNQSRVYIYKNDYQTAKDKLLKAVKIAPNYLDAHYYLALVFYNLSDNISAQNQLDTVLYLYPEHKGAQNLKKIIQNI